MHNVQIGVYYSWIFLLVLFLVFELRSILYFTVVNSVLDMAKYLVGIIAKYAFDANLFQLGSSIFNRAGSQGPKIRWGVCGGKKFNILTEFKQMQISFSIFSSFQIYMRDAEYCEKNEKSNFRFFCFFIFRVIVIFEFNIWSIFDEFPRSLEKKIGFFFPFFIRFWTFLNYLDQKYDNGSFWGKGGVSACR